ncbi:TonB-dependent receptor [Sphingopyxis sp. Root154]|uniref:TonB-dependent receptor n=1 Tax=Sphingopyxis sp. Root154 TaxID=1736476 RepID=UPI00138F36A9|nr:TonB-dependent receptor [Sphingopyxis sp. Root154]
MPNIALRLRTRSPPIIHGPSFRFRCGLRALTFMGHSFYNAHAFWQDKTRIGGTMGGFRMKKVGLSAGRFGRPMARALMCGGTCLGFIAAPAAAQTSGTDASTTSETRAAGNDDEIIVTARKTQERLLDVPVAASTLSAEALTRYATSDLSNIAEQVVGVQLAKGISSTSGGSFSIRGVGNLANDLGNEQPVAINIDGVQLTRGRVVSVSQFDVERIEVLKGPQSLFFGKNSPAGVVSILSTNPKIGGPVEGYAKVQYQFTTNTPSFEGAVSLPISDTFAIRVAGRASKMHDGYVRNVAQPLADPFPAEAGLILPGATYEDLPGTQVSAARVTAVWEPSDDFQAVLKSLYSVERTRGGSGVREILQCGGTRPTTYGIPDPTGDCAGNNVISNGLPPALVVANLYNAPEDGKPFSRTRVWLSSLNMDVTLGPVTVTSVTGLFDFANGAFDNFDYTSYGQATNTQRETGWQFTQELRAVSDFDGPINFSAGIFYQKDRRDYVSGTKIAALGPFAGPGEFNGIYDSLITTASNRGSAYSAFGQLRWKILDTLELAGGVRWTHEKKSTDIGNIFNRLAPFSPAGIRYKPKFSGDNVSPEATLTWKPAPNLTIYGAYKTGYLSGGSSNPATVVNYSVLADPLRPFRYDEETVEGGEIGIKASLFGGQLTGDLTVYRYDYKGLQVQTFDATTTSYFTQNAGGARNQGIEGQLRYRVAPELTLRVAASYADTKFTDYDGGQCYAGQPLSPAPAPGQSKVPGNCYPIGAGKGRYLTGLRYGPAPFQAIAGMTYDTPIGDGSWNFGLTFDGYFYNRTPAWNIPTSPGGAPHSNFNASVRFYQPDNGWEVAAIFTNLTNSDWFPPATIDKPLGTPGDIVGDAQPPRLVTLQAVYRF